eukprot:656593-Alexandrium_andersonii.AAC.1
MDCLLSTPQQGLRREGLQTAPEKTTGNRRAVPWKVSESPRRPDGACRGSFPYGQYVATPCF